MKLSRAFGIVTCFALALGVTAGVFHLDRQRAKAFETVAALRWARQITSQAESMAMNAKLRGERDPVSWAVDYLSQGIEPRIIQVSRLDAIPANDSGDLELFELDRARGVFEYSKVIELSDRSGIKVLLDVGYSGFLGARSKFANDFSVALFFVVTWLLAHFLVLPRFWMRNEEKSSLESSVAPVVDLPIGIPAASAPAPKPARAPREGKLKTAVTAWFGESKEAVTTLSVAVRDLLRQAQLMSGAAHQSLSPMESLRDRIHEGLNEIHASRQTFKNAVQLANQLEALSLASDDGANHEQMQELIAQLKDACVSGDQTARELEIKIEPWALDADLVLEAQRAVIQSTVEMGDGIQKAKEQLMLQAKLLKDLNAHLAPKAPKAEKQPEEPVVEVVERSA